MGMLQDYSGMTVSVVTAVTLGTPLLRSLVSCDGLTILSDSSTANRSPWIFAVFPHRLSVVSSSQLISADSLDLVSYLCPLRRQFTRTAEGVRRLGRRNRSSRWIRDPRTRRNAHQEDRWRLQQRCRLSSAGTSRMQS